MEPLVSIIVPVYNAGKYLSRCINSLIRQTLSNIEIIAVLDCPTDGSDVLVKDFAKKDNRIIVIENESNMHIGLSRNKGLDAARGKYIAFCDHDDFYDESMCEKMVSLMESQMLDMVVSPYVALINGEISINYSYPNFSAEELSKAVFETAVGIVSAKDPMRRFSLSGVIWNKLFRRSIIEEHSLRFIDTRVSSPEDLAFLMEYSFYAKTCGLCNENLYYHVWGIGNTGSSAAYNETVKFLNGMEHTYHFLEKQNLLQSMHKRYNNSVRALCHISLAKMLRVRGVKSFFDCLSEVSKRKCLQEAYKEMRFTVMPAKIKLKSLLMLFFEKFWIRLQIHIHKNTQERLHD